MNTVKIKARIKKAKKCNRLFVAIDLGAVLHSSR